MTGPATPSQTAGPFVSIGTDWLAPPDRPAAGGGQAAIRIYGRVVDGAGEAVTDAMLEFWQADPEGRYPPDTPDGWLGLTRAFTDAGGDYRLDTVRPGSAGGWAPHLVLSIFARGLMQRLVTRLYFADEAAANAEDPLWARLAEDMRKTLTARPDGSGGYRFDVHLQGDEETVFFAPFES